ncbi:MAG: AbrB/MazE/SpoVT family DNA-binding domain-containing protein [Nitrospirae bacterium]|nr:AbrB/MazE/SpoVT family DNA-binding domain-containing protein [Nitrospirota bacterium]
MLIAIDKRGSINLPTAVRKRFKLEKGTYLDLSFSKGGAIVLSPVEIYPTVRLNDKGIAKLQEARHSGRRKLPEWIVKEMKSADADSK